MLYGRIELADDSVFALEINFVWKIENCAWEFKGFFITKEERKALTVLCSVVKHLGSG